MVLDLQINEGDTAFMFFSTALVQFMTPGLAFFYGGLVRSNNVLSILIQSLTSMGVVMIFWYVVGFSLTFGEPWLGSFLGNPWTFFCFRNVSIYEPLVRDGEVIGPGIPGVLFAMYQGMFAVITPALICGAFVGRFSMLSFLLFIVLWMTVVYCPIGYWNWGGGWMMQMGMWDFAGGLVVHQSSGFSALATVVILGRRNIFESNKHEAKTPHNLPFVVLGTAILWFGWFGFNGGSALSSGGLCSISFANSHMAASSGLVTWMTLDVVLGGKPKLTGACAGIVGGLVAITPAAGFVQVWGALLIGILASVTCRSAVQLVETLDWDDATDVWGVHGVGGFLGTILTGVLADGPECADKVDAPGWCANPGTITFSFSQVAIQTLGAVVTGAYAFGVTCALVKGLSLILPNAPKGSEIGSDKFDLEELGEVAYVFSNGHRNGKSPATPSIVQRSPGLLGDPPDLASPRKTSSNCFGNPCVQGPL
mmetsp:Transcript_677/g.1580  ORF Transcript_677/g.1580 Transcript_677/m.1580 type:complete len:480 (-) Transcript_677:113-1552(-)